MVRNLKTSNELPCMPIRCWRKITLGPRRTRTRSAVSARIGAATVINKTDKNLSRQGFQVRTYAPCRLAVVLACGGPRLPKPAAVMPYSSPLDAMFFTSRHEPHFSSPPCTQPVAGDSAARSPPSMLSVRIRFCDAARPGRSPLALADQASEQSLHGEPWLAVWFARPGSLYI